MDSDDKNQNGNLHIYLGAGVFFAWMLYEKCCHLILRMFYSKWWPYWKLALSLPTAATAVGILVWIIGTYRKRKRDAERESAILGPGEGAVFSGTDSSGQDVYLKPKQRAMHTQVVGTTNAGKAESVILPWAIQDIQQGRGLILIDGKADKSLLDKLWAYTVKAGRQADFRLFSLSSIAESHQFNPLVGGTSEEITERVFNAFEFENPHYRSLQFDVFSQVMRLFSETKTVPTFSRIHQCITKPILLRGLADKVTSEELKNWVSYFTGLTNNEREQRTSGLVAALSHFALGSQSVLFNSETPAITLDSALTKNRIVYFQLPVLLSPFLGKATGKMILQSLQCAVANRHRAEKRSPRFYSVFLDDFSEYLYPGFVSILNKSRSANVGVVFAHQALGDIEGLGDPIANAILTNSNIKVIMRGNDPASAEYFSKVVGTKKGMKYTERQKLGFLMNQETGDVSAREVEEFVIHPNKFKREMGVGEAIMIVPHDRGSKAIEIKFKKYDDLPAQPIKSVRKESAALLTQGVPQNENQLVAALTEETESQSESEAA